MTAIWKKEFRSYFTNMIGYIFISILLIMAGIYAVYRNFVMGSTAFEAALSNMLYIFMVIVPLLTMGALATEKKQKTDQLLLTSPVTVPQVVLGKYLALVSVYLVAMLVLCLYPLIFSIYGTVNFASAYTAIFGMFLMGSAMIAIGMFISGLTESQIIAAVISVGAFLLIYLLSGIANLLSSSAQTSLFCLAGLILVVGIVLYAFSRSPLISGGVMILGILALLIVYFVNPLLLEGAFPALLMKLAIFTRLSNFTSGIFDVTGVVYYLSVAVFFCLLTVQSIEKRRWS